MTQHSMGNASKKKEMKATVQSDDRNMYNYTDMDD